MKPWPGLARAQPLCLIAAIVILVVAGLAFYHFPTYSQASYAFIGRAIVLGKLPYRDVWDNKLPSIHYVNALWHVAFGGNYVLHRVAQIAILLGCVALLAEFARREAIPHWGAAALGLALVLSLPDIGQWNYTEPYAVLFILLALVALQRGQSLASGIALGVAATFWIPSTLMLLALFVYARERGKVRSFVHAVLGFLALGAVYGAAMLHTFGASRLVELIGDMRSYERQKWIPHEGPLWYTVRNRLADTLMATGLLAPLLVFVGIVRLPRSPRERFGLAWLAATFAGAAVNLNFSDHYFVPALPALAFAIATFAQTVRASLARRCLWTALALVALAYGPKTWNAMRTAYASQRATAEDAGTVARILTETLRPDAPILVYAADQGLYLRADRDAAGRFSFMVGIVQTPPERQRVRLQEYVLDVRRAGAVVVDRHAFVPQAVSAVLHSAFVPACRTHPAYQLYPYEIYLARTERRDAARC
jgi:hypothetical protein